MLCYDISCKLVLSCVVVPSDVGKQAVPVETPQQATEIHSRFKVKPRASKGHTHIDRVPTQDRFRFFLSNTTSTKKVATVAAKIAQPEVTMRRFGCIDAMVCVSLFLRIIFLNFSFGSVRSNKKLNCIELFVDRWAFRHYQHQESSKCGF